MKGFWGAVALVCAAAASPSLATPITLDFVKTSGGGADNAPFSATDRFRVLVDNVGGNAVFTFERTGALKASLAVLYFQDIGDALGAASLGTSSGAPGVSYQAGGSPGNPPSVNPFQTHYLFGASGNVHSAVNLDGEFQDVVFALNGGGFQGVLDGLASGQLRVAIHMRQIEDPNDEDVDYSDTYASTPTIIPLPPAVWSAAGGLVLAGAVVARKRRRH